MHLVKVKPLGEVTIPELGKQRLAQIQKLVFLIVLVVIRVLAAEVASERGGRESSSDKTQLDVEGIAKEESSPASPAHDPATVPAQRSPVDRLRRRAPFYGAFTHARGGDKTGPEVLVDFEGPDDP